MADNQYAVSTWGQPNTFDYKTPSGQICLMRQLDVEDLIELDVLSEIDRLSSLVNSEHIEPAQSGRRVPQDHKPKKLTAAQLEAEQRDAFRKITSNKKDFAVLTWVMDGVVAAAVIQPALTRSYQGVKDDYVKIPYEDRETGLVYTDSVPFADRMQIFTQAIGSMDNLATFREGSGEGVGDVEGKPGDALPAKRDVEDLGEHPAILS